MRFIGITGGVGAGKTEILKYIGQHYNVRSIWRMRSGIKSRNREPKAIMRW